MGNVLLPKWLDLRRVKVHLTPVGKPGQRREATLRNTRGKRVFRFDWLRSGTYNISVSLREFPDPVLRIDAVDLAVGQSDLHPRLQDIDLASRVHQFDIYAVDERGQAIKPTAPLVARVRRPGGAEAYVGFRWRGNRAKIISGSPQLEVLPESRDYRAQPTVLGPGRSQVRFQRIPALTLRVPGLRKVVGDSSVWLSLRLVKAAESRQLLVWNSGSRRVAYDYRRAADANHAKMGQDERARLRPGRDGRYRVLAYLVGASKVNFELGQVDVRLVPGGRDQEVAMTFDRDRVTAMLARMRELPATGPSGK